MKVIFLILFMLPVISFMLYIVRDLSSCAVKKRKIKATPRKPVYSYTRKEKHLHIAK